jgi:hypothetical protein
MADKWIWGCVNGDGTIHSCSGSSGFDSSSSGLDFSVEKTGNEGVFMITYVKAFARTPAVVLTQLFPQWTGFDYRGGDPRDNAVLIASDATHVKVKMGTASGDGSYRHFSFIAIGAVKDTPVPPEMPKP